MKKASIKNEDDRTKKETINDREDVNFDCCHIEKENKQESRNRPIQTKYPFVSRVFMIAESLQFYKSFDEPNIWIGLDNHNEICFQNANLSNNNRYNTSINQNDRVKKMIQEERFEVYETRLDDNNKNLKKEHF